MKKSMLIIILCSFLFASSNSVMAQSKTVTKITPVSLPHRTFASVVRQPVVGWHSDTTNVTVMLNDSTFKKNCHRIMKFYRTQKGTSIDNSVTIYDAAWIFINPEDVFDVK